MLTAMLDSFNDKLLSGFEQLLDHKFRQLQQLPDKSNANLGFCNDTEQNVHFSEAFQAAPDHHQDNHEEVKPEEKEQAPQKEQRQKDEHVVHNNTHEHWHKVVAPQMRKDLKTKSAKTGKEYMRYNRQFQDWHVNTIKARWCTRGTSG